jgi:hypothetical protein
LFLLWKLLLKQHLLADVISRGVLGFQDCELITTSALRSSVVAQLEFISKLLQSWVLAEVESDKQIQDIIAG